MLPICVFQGYVQVCGVVLLRVDLYNAYMCCLYMCVKVTCRCVCVCVCVCVATNAIICRLAA